jgi:hypothetical protein
MSQTEPCRANLHSVQSIQHALNNFSPSDADPKAVVKRANWLLNELDQEAISTEDQVALTTILTTNQTHQAKMDLQKAILHLRDDHINVANDLLELKIRISKLEDNVRALTAQRNSAQDAPRMAQEIEATTRYGKNVVLKIPKGQALVPLRPSRSPTPSPPNHSADSAPSSQVSEDNVTVDGADQPTSSQSTSEITTQPEDPKVETLEKVSYTPQIESQSLADQQLPTASSSYPSRSCIPCNLVHQARAARQRLGVWQFPAIFSCCSRQRSHYYHFFVGRIYARCHSSGSDCTRHPTCW